jgi:hypothetical protein
VSARGAAAAPRPERGDDDGVRPGGGRRVVLVSLGAAPPGEALVAGVQQLRRAGAQVHLVSRVPQAAPLAVAVTARTAIGRGRVGPIVAGRLTLEPYRLPGALRVVFGRRTRSLVRAADLLVAVDAAALPATWLAARVNRRARAVRGLPAG